MGEREQVTTSDEKVSSFRGYWSIKDVHDNVQPLLAFLRENKPTCRRVTMKRKDYDLVCRWPKAAQLLGFVVSEEGVRIGEFEIVPDKSPARYKEKESA